MKLILLGGFLGSGKTTAIVNACRLLLSQNKKVAVITNDQGDQQVDSALIKSLGIPGKEVPNGCFCCNYNQLDAHIEELTKVFQPDVIFAESVGSCTDLVATIAKPLSIFRPELEVIISVFADASMVASVLEGTSLFVQESVRYIFKKQLEEADLMVINKADLTSQLQRTHITTMIQSEYPGKKVLFQNSLQEEGIIQWLERMDRLVLPAQRVSLALDYDTYGEGEAELAWLDKRLRIQTTGGEAVVIASKIIKAFHERIREHRLWIGHLKFFIEADKWQKKISFTSTGSDSLSSILPAPLSHSAGDQRLNLVNLLINARVQTDPETLRLILDEVIADIRKEAKCTIGIEKSSVFKPGYPRPTHGLA